MSQSTEGCFLVQISCLNAKKKKVAVIWRRMTSCVRRAPCGRGTATRFSKSHLFATKAPVAKSPRGLAAREEGGETTLRQERSRRDAPRMGFSGRCSRTLDTHFAQL